MCFFFCGCIGVLCAWIYSCCGYRDGVEGWGGGVGLLRGHLKMTAHEMNSNPQC